MHMSDNNRPIEVHQLVEPRREIRIRVGITEESREPLKVLIHLHNDTDTVVKESKATG